LIGCDQPADGPKVFGNQYHGRTVGFSGRRLDPIIQLKTSQTILVSPTSDRELYFRRHAASAGRVMRLYFYGLRAVNINAKMAGFFTCQTRTQSPQSLPPSFNFCTSFPIYAPLILNHARNHCPPSTGRQTSRQNPKDSPSKLSIPDQDPPNPQSRFFRQFTSFSAFLRECNDIHPANLSFLGGKGWRGWLTNGRSVFAKLLDGWKFSAADSEHEARVYIRLRDLWASVMSEFIKFRQ
jgi:hypothetical protein